MSADERSHLAARAVSTRLKTAGDPLFKSVQARSVGRADEPQGFGSGWHHIGLIAAVGEDAVHSLVVGDVLSQSGYPHVSQHRSIQCIATGFGSRRSVGSFARIGGSDGRDRQRAHVEQLSVGRVHHHGGINVVKRASFYHEDFAASAFFGWSAQDTHPSAELFSSGCQSQTCAQAGGSNYVVAAGVADAGESIVFADYADGRARGTGFGNESRWQIASSSLHGDAFGG